MRFQKAPELEGWNSQEIGRVLFFIYTRPDFEGCIRLHSGSGTAEVFMDKSPLEDPYAEPIFYEKGHVTPIIEPSTEPLERARLCAEYLIGLLTDEEQPNK